MYQYHQLEFWKHCKQKLLLDAITMLCMLLLCSYWVLDAYCIICWYTEYSMDEPTNFNSICFKADSFFKTLIKNNQYLFIFETSQLLPVWAYFLLSKDHDCFRCFGKDPTRNYSSYQYTAREKVIRRLKSKG